MENVNASTLEILFEKLEHFLRTETVVGSPIQIGQVTLVPIVEIAFGAGAGGGSGKDGKGNDGSGGGAGTGAKISPNAVLVIKESEVTLLTLKDKGSLEKVIQMVPDIVSKFKGDNKDKESAE